MKDDLLQKYLARLEAGEPLESVLAEVPVEEAELLRTAAALRDVPAPARAAASVTRQRQRLVAAVKGDKTMSDSSRSSKRRTWSLAFLAGSAGLALVCVFGLVLAAVLLFRGNSNEGIAGGPDSIQGPLSSPLASALEAPDPQTGILQAARGLVEVRTGSEWQAVSAGASIVAGQAVRTGSLSSATLVFYDGSVASLGPDTEIVISLLDAERDGARIIQFVQVVGETDHAVAHSEDIGSLYEVVAVNGSGQARGTAFHVSVSETLAVNFTVTEGTVAVTNAGETVLVSEGQTTLFDVDEAPIPPASSFSGEGEVLQIGEFWYIAGQTMLVDPATVIEGDPQVGDWVAFSGRIMPGGVRVADHITLIRSSMIDTFTFTGIVETIGTTEWGIGGRVVLVDDQTAVEAGIEVDDDVEVSGIIDGNGDFLARQIRLADEGTEATFVFAGIVETMDPAAWVISDLSILVTNETIIDPAIVLDDQVQVTGKVLEDGTWQAETIALVDEATDETGTFGFGGVVISTDPWNVSGVPFDVDENTQIDDGIQTGNRVRVSGVVLPDGSWLAESIVQYDNGQRHAIHFAARVESIDPWIIGGTEVTVDSHTRIIGEIEVGDLVTVKGNLDPDGTIVANKITLVTAASGCTLETATISAAEGNTITLNDGQVLTLTPEVEVSGSLEVGAVVVVETCPDEDGQPVVASITVLEVSETEEPTAGEAEQVVICHIPAGDMTKAHTISVGADAVEAHLAHGDLMGPCP